MQSCPEKPGMTDPTSPTPLTITSVLGSGAFTGSLMNPPDDIDFTALSNQWIYRSRFDWSENDAAGKVLHKFDTYNMWSLSTGKVIPWQAFTHGITQFISYSFEICLLFVKLPDVRVSLCIRNYYFHPQNTQPSGNVPNAMEETVIEINNEETCTFKMVPYWNGVSAFNDTLAGECTSAYWPRVITDIEVRNPYVPTNLQPKKFETLVFVRPCDEQPQGTMITPNYRTLALT